MPYISKIEMRGFKSFGHSKVSIPLSNGLTAIIGPNGQGKSNIFDAMCFVLGEMSNKLMRVKHLSDLIYWGDQNNGRRPAPFAEVALHFNNKDGKIPVNSESVMISRQVSRSGDCVYKINNRRASRQEIVDLLAPTMTSSGGYNFVMQGDVARFINMNQVERRLIIDDLAGVAEYDEKKQKSITELQRVETNLSMTSTRLDEISANMGGLKTQMETAMRHKQLSLELDQVRATLLLIKKETQTKRLSDLKSRIEKLDEEVQSLKRRHQAVLDEIGKQEEKIGTLEKFIEEKQDADVLEEAGTARAQVDAFSGLLRAAAARQPGIERRIVELTERIKKTGGLSGTISERVVTLTSKFKELHGRFNALSKSLVDNKSLDDAEEILHKIRTVLNELAHIIDTLQTQLPSLPQQGPSREPTIDDLRSELIGLNGTRSELETQLADLREKIKQAQAKLESSSALEREVRSSIAKLRTEREELRAKARELEGKARALDAKIRAQDGTLQGWRVQRESIEGELNRIKEDMKKVKVEASLPLDSNPAILEQKAGKLESDINSLGEVNFRAIQDFRVAERRYNSEKVVHDKLVTEKQSLLDFMLDIDEKKKEVFMKTFNEISRHFSEIFSQLSPEGIGELVLENKESPFDGGLDIRAKPQGKEISNVVSISGGEKALTALAFIFALQRYRPTTFYVLDEIDAHLDPQNRKRVAEMLRQFSRESQIVVITLHDAMMSSADRLFGITMENKISRVFSVELSGLGG